MGTSQAIKREHSIEQVQVCTLLFPPLSTFSYFIMISETAKPPLDLENLGPMSSKVEGGIDNTSRPYDPVFGEITEDGPNYRNVGLPTTSYE